LVFILFHFILVHFFVNKGLINNKILPDCPAASSGWKANKPTFRVPSLFSSSGD